MQSTRAVTIATRLLVWLVSMLLSSFLNMRVDIHYSVCHSFSPYWGHMEDSCMPEMTACLMLDIDVVIEEEEEGIDDMAYD